jgi:hypothetical protein
MLEAKQHAHFCYLPNFSVPAPINDLVKRGLEELAYLFLPEDTTDKPGCRKNEMSRPGENNIHNTFKLVLWVVVSITFSLAVGQL